LPRRSRADADGFVKSVHGKQCGFPEEHIHSIPEVQTLLRLMLWGTLEYLPLMSCPASLAARPVRMSAFEDDMSSMPRDRTMADTSIRRRKDNQLTFAGSPSRVAPRDIRRERRAYETVVAETAIRG